MATEAYANTNTTLYNIASTGTNPIIYMQRIILSVFVIATLLLSGCVLTGNKPFTKQESAAIVETARKKLETAYPDMDYAAKVAIASPPTSFQYYRLSGDYLQYFITWSIASNRIGRVFGQGNIWELEDATVEIRSLPSREEYYRNKR